MALPSQTSRAETWRSSGSSGNSLLSALTNLIGQNKPLFAGGFIAALAIGGYFYFKPGSTPGSASASPTNDTFLPAGQTPQVAAKPLGAENANPPAAQKPSTISMGALNDNGTTTGAKPSLDDLLAQPGTKNQPAPTTPAPTVGGQPNTATPPTPPAPTPSPDATNPAGTTPTDPLAAPASPATPGADVAALIDQANRLVQQNKPVEARTTLNDALMNPAITAEGRGVIRSQIASINQTLFFSPTAFKGDTLTDEHAVASGETLGKIVRKEGLPIDWRLLVRINKMPSENALRIGQKLKIVRQPMHAVVHKNSYRMDIYAGPPSSGGSPGPDGQDAGWTYIRSFSVGLGESNGTPEGSFIVKTNSKLVNPRWVNPRTGEVFEKDDPKNPIGERWIGLEGVDENTRKFTGYGIHGTVDADSIGQQKSMGCVRLNANDVEMVYEMLIDRLSTVRIVP